ncbi:MAG: hypothetical protein E6G57_01255 [Actinobacteria bacterium]|nr:MAG: hypothetical protein E6G57_01255 [Actinomycetota bacterium]
MKAARARLLVVAAAGIVIAHAADYALAFPDPTRRGRALSASGHGYWPAAVALAVVCGAAAVARAVRRGWRSAGPRASLPATAARLATGQVLLFTLLETVERLAVGAHPLLFLSSGAFALGVVLQVAVAVAAVLLLRGVEVGARRLLFLSSGAFALGVVLQVAVAVAAVLLLRVVEVGARRVAAALRPSRHPDIEAAAWLSRTVDVVVSWWGVAGDARGPPSLLPA